MEITPLHIYLFSVLDNLHCCSLVFLTILALITIFLGVVTYAVSYDGCKNAAVMSKWFKGVLIAMGCVLPFYVLAPSGKTMVAMYVIPKIVNNEAVQQLPGELLEFVRSYLKENQKKE